FRQLTPGRLLTEDRPCYGHRDDRDRCEREQRVEADRSRVFDCVIIEPACTRLQEDPQPSSHLISSLPARGGSTRGAGSTPAHSEPSRMRTVEARPASSRSAAAASACGTPNARRLVVP